MTKKQVAAAALLVLAGTASADVGLTASIGTTGLGIHGATPLNQALSARVGANFLKYSDSAATRDVSYTFDLTLRSVDVLLDYYPSAQPFRLTAGIVLNGNRADARGRSTASGTYTIEGTTYAVADVGTVEGTVEFRRVAPYLGIGWGSGKAAQKGWSLAADLGVMFQGSPRTSLSSTGCTAPTSVCDQFAQDLAAENRRLAEELKEFKFFPVVRIGASYRF